MTTANVIGLAASRGVGTVAGRLLTDSDFFRAIYNTDIANVFFNTFEFGEICSVYHSTKGQWINYETLYDDPHISGSVMSEADFNTFRPQVQLREGGLLQPIQKTDRVKVRGVVHIVDDVVSDGVGVSTVYLRVK